MKPNSNSFESISESLREGARARISNPVIAGLCSTIISRVVKEVDSTGTIRSWKV